MRFGCSAAAFQRGILVRRPEHNCRAEGRGATFKPSGGRSYGSRACGVRSSRVDLAATKFHRLEACATERNSPYVQLKSCFFSGNERMRLPVAANTALQIDGATQPMISSPIPAMGSSVARTKWT